LVKTILKEDVMPTKLQPVTAPQVKNIEEKIVESIEELMRQYLSESSWMQLKDKKTILRKIVRMCTGL
jgi:hypothetical protein